MRRFFLGLCLLASLRCRAQAPDTLVLPVPQLLLLADQHNPQLRVAQAGVEAARQTTVVARTARLPTISASLSANYISNIQIIQPDFSERTVGKAPHMGNSFAVEAGQLIWGAGAVRKSIQLTSLQEQLAELTLSQNQQDVHMLLLGHYLDLATLYNQRAVYRRNIQETQLLIRNIQSRLKHGTVLRTDLIRNELQLSNLNLGLLQTTNDIAIANQQLVLGLGLPEGTVIRPEAAGPGQRLPTASLPQNQQLALAHNPDLQQAAVQEQVAAKNVEYVQAGRYPTLSWFVNNNLGRPFLYDLPPVDIYYNLWMAGLSLKYNVGGLYTTKQRTRLAVAQQVQQQRGQELAAERVSLAVHAATIKHQESIDRLATLEKGVELATENYRRVTQSYRNQLALLTDLLDASNAKLDAELQLANAKIRTVYTSYQLQRAIGTL